MTRLTDEEIQFYIDNPWSKVDLEPIATELRQAREEIKYLTKVCYEKQVAVLEHDVEFMKTCREYRADIARLREALQKMRSNLLARAEELEDEMLGDDGFMNNYSEMTGERLAYLEVISQLDNISTQSTQAENVSKDSEKINI